MDLLSCHPSLAGAGDTHLLLHHKERMAHESVATIDAETRSACSLVNSGSWAYSLHPTTELLCLAYRLPHWATGRTALWHPAFPYLSLKEGEDFDDLTELFQWVTDGEPVEAHNSWFERGVWTNLLPNWPQLKANQWRCSAAKAATHALPRALRGAALALGLDITKNDAALRSALDLDGESTRVMTKLSQPRKPLAAERKEWGVLHAGCRQCCGSGKVKGTNPLTGRAKQIACQRCGGAGWKGTVPPMPLLYHETRELLQELWAYCRQDVLAEEALSSELPDLSPDELQVFLLDQVVNERGFQLDREAVEAALALIDDESVTLNGELFALTDGQVCKATQRAQMVVWLETQGLRLDNTRKETIDALLEDTPLFIDGEELPGWDVALPPKAKRALELMRALGRSSTAKYDKMQSWMCPDARVRGGLLYHGATTGRWSGKGIQPHNFPKGSLSPTLKKCTQDDLWNTLKTRDSALVAQRYGNTMEALSHGLRGAIVAAPGHQLYVADYAGIEARVLNWLADNEEALDIFRTGADIYCYMADEIYGYLTNKTDHPKERGVGKIAVLGLGYQMGAGKFVATCALGGVTILEDNECIHCGKWGQDHWRQKHPHTPVDPNEITAFRIVQAYRTKFWRVKEMWAEQEECAIAAVTHHGSVLQAGHMTWFEQEGFLYCELPSGRRLAYPDPQVRQTQTSWGATRDQLTFMGVDSHTHQWVRQHTYGGMIVENETQAVARDLMAGGLVRCEQSGLYVPVLTVHDELLAEAPIGAGSVAEFESILTTNDEWAAGLPIGAEGWVGQRYAKG